MSSMDTSINGPGLVWNVLLAVSVGYVEALTKDSQKVSCILHEYLSLVEWMHEWVNDYDSLGTEIWREVEIG